MAIHDSRVIRLRFLALDGADALAPACEGLLDDAEAARAQRFVFARDRLRFTLAHAALRCLLAQEAGAEPALVRYRCGPRGRPVLAGPAAAWKIGFSLSRAAGWALLAYGRGCQIGVDLESTAGPTALEPAHLQPYLSPAAMDWLVAQGAPRDSAPLLRCWTRVEALAKARGSGIAIGPHALLERPADAGPQIVDAEDDAGRLRRWQLLDLAAPAGLCAALATDRDSGLPAAGGPLRLDIATLRDLGPLFDAGRAAAARCEPVQAWA